MATPRLEDVHDKSKRYDWGFDYGIPRPRYKTRYIIPPKGKDPFRVLIRDYMAMESEKDARVFGALDADVRYRNADAAEPRFIESMKFAVPAFTDAEYQAGCPVAMRAREPLQGRLTPLVASLTEAITLLPSRW